MADFVPVSLKLAETDMAGFAAALGASYAETGFVVVSDHDIDDRLIATVKGQFRLFFAWPDEHKKRFHVPGGGGQRGYTPFGVETAKGATHHDLKEFWHIGRELDSRHPLHSQMLPNVWIDGMTSFRENCLALYEAFDRMGALILQAIARYLSLPEDWFADKVNVGNSILRVIHYPPVLGENLPNVRAGAHEDINVITLLLGAEEGGLEVLHRSGNWLPISPPPGALVVNIGDMLQRLCNHVLPSTSHRVVNPAPSRARFARYSMPFFLHFNSDFLIETLPHCITAENPDRYPEAITAEAFLQQRLREIKLA